MSSLLSDIDIEEYVKSLFGDSQIFPTQKGIVIASNYRSFVNWANHNKYKKISGQIYKSQNGYHWKFVSHSDRLRGWKIGTPIVFLRGSRKSPIYHEAQNMMLIGEFENMSETLANT